MFGFFSMTASMVMAMYEYPSFATSQFAVVFFVLLGGIFWFLPTALISAEMASVEGWSEGGVFGWVGNALHSDRLGFMALFFQWFQITVGLVTMSYFVIGMLADITAALADMRVSILQINVTARSGASSAINMKVGCRNIDHCNSIVSRLRGLNGVLNILRGFS